MVAFEVSKRWLVGISGFWFATSYKWFLILVFLLPGQVAQIVPGGEKSGYWGAVFGIGALWAVFGPALFGDWSDRHGDRRPFILAGSLLTVLALVVLYHASAIWMLTLGYLLLQISDDLATGPYSAIIPEVVPQDARGRASGMMGVAMSLSQVAAVLAVLAMAEQRLALYLSIALLNVGAAVVAVRLLPARGKPTAAGSFVEGWLSPWKHAAFRWVWLTRFLATLGFYVVVPYANFYFRDVATDLRLLGFDLRSPDRATAVLGLVMALSGAVAAGIAGSLADRKGRKTVTVASACLMASGLLAAVTLPGLLLLLLLVVAVGAGYGAFQAVNWAIVSDVLPERERLGRDMGVWQMSISSVQILAGGAGWILTWGNAVRAGGGYQLLFALAGGVVLLGGLAATRVPGVR